MPHAVSVGSNITSLKALEDANHMEKRARNARGKVWHTEGPSALGVGTAKGQTLAQRRPDPPWMTERPPGLGNLDPGYI